MATTSNTMAGINGSKTDFAFTFPYLKQSDLKVELIHSTHGSTTLDNTKFTYANATTISLSSGSGTNWQETSGAPKSGVTGRIYRDTASTALAATFYPGSAIRSSDLNDNYTQNLYVTQEAENDASDALTNSRTLESGSYVSAITKATAAVSTANTASTNATNAVNTANTASTNATNAVNTANTASSNATAAVSTANTASTNATNAVSTANTAASNATAAVSTANTASTNASNAVSTANAADTIADTAKLATDRCVATTSNGGATWTLTGNNTNASTDPKGVGYAVTQAEAAVTTANAASAAVSAAVLYTSKATVAAWAAATYTEDDYIEIADSTGIEAYNAGTSPKLTGLPATFQGAAGLTVRLQYTHSGTTFAYMSYFANDPEDRYLPNPRPFRAGTPGVTYTVKVAAKNSFHRYNGTGSSNGFLIDGEQAPFLEWTPGVTYRFDQADSSNANHTLKFYEEADKTTLYTTGVTHNGTPGSAGAYTQIVTTDTLPTVLHYMAVEQAHEGNGVQTNTAFDRTALPVIDGGDFTLTSSHATVTTTYDGGAFT